MASAQIHGLYTYVAPPTAFYQFTLTAIIVELQVMHSEHVNNALFSDDDEKRNVLPCQYQLSASGCTSQRNPAVQNFQSSTVCLTSHSSENVDDVVAFHINAIATSTKHRILQK